MKKKAFKKKSAIFYTVILGIVFFIACAGSLPYIISHYNEPRFDSVSSENEPVNPDKYGRPAASDEMRGVWVPYISLHGVNKAKIDAIVQKAKSKGMNTIFFHVRPFGDALYKSEYFPWSHLITGTQGKAAENGFDPLAYAVEAAHREGLELHAWVNPLRIMLNNGNYPQELCDENLYNVWRNDGNSDNDDWVVDYKKGKYYNPAIPEVREIIAKDAADIARIYNVDGIHWDDYFYPTNDDAFDDSKAYQKYLQNGGELSLSDWRIQNINALVKSVYSAIKEVDSTVEFGISPAGNIENCLAAGADVREWGKSSGYVDYLCPQIYWTDDNTIAPYREMCSKWRGLVKNDSVKLYIGLALYKAGSDNDKGKWKTSDDIIMNQVMYLRSSDIHANGFSLYSYDYLENTQTVTEMENLMKVLK